MDKNEFLGILYLVYIGDRNAFDSIVAEWENQNALIDHLQKENKELQENLQKYKKQ
jgi:hypothetical protein